MKMLADPGKSVIIYSEMSPDQSWTEKPLSTEKGNIPKVG